MLAKHLQTNNEGSVGNLYPYNRTHLVEIKNAYSAMLVYGSSSSMMRNDVSMQREALEELSTMFRGAFARCETSVKLYTKASGVLFKWWVNWV